MSLSLNATLQTAQDSANHKIIVELLKSDANEIPFLGEYLTNETTNEQKPNIITHSSGRICGIYIYGTDNINYVYTDASREEFQTIITLNDQTDLGLGGAVTIDDCSIVELADNTIGLVFICHDGSNYYLRQTVLSITGTVSSNALIDTYAIASYPEVRSPFCILMASGDYLLVYIVEDTTPEWTIYQRTCNDFSTWSAEAALSIGGISTEEKHNVSLHQIDTDDVFIFFDYENVSDVLNCYYSISADDGTTWAAAVAITSYAASGLVGKHPIGMQQATDTMHITYNEQTNPMHVDDTTTNWPGGNADVTSLHLFDDDVYMVCINKNGSGNDSLIAVVNVDIGTWSIIRSWNTASTPAFGAIFGAEDCIWNTGGHDGRYIVIATRTGQVAVLNLESNTITDYNFFANATYSIEANTDWTPQASSGISADTLAYAMVKNNILYCIFYYIDATTRPYEIVSLDLNQSGPIYKVNQVYYGLNVFSEADLLPIYWNQAKFKFFPKANISVQSILWDEAYQVYNTTAVDADSVAFHGACFDGRYIYFCPFADHLGNPSGQVTRYDTTGSFTDAGSWAVYDTTAVNANSKGFWGIVYDNSRYIYLIPYDNGATFGQITRYDTTGSFTDAGSWAVYDTTAVDANSKGFIGGCFDGRYLYLCPYYSDDYSGQVTRYDTTGSFTDAGSYAIFDATTVSATAKGYHGAVYDGRNVYFVPNYEGFYHGEVLCYDTHGNFTSGASWKVCDTEVLDADSLGFSDAVYDNSQYIYFVPYFNGSVSGQVTRYDTKQTFNDSLAWSFFDTTTIDAGSKGFSGAIFDGRYIFFIPYFNTDFSGQITRYDTKRDFTDSAAWSIFDTTDIDAGSVGFSGGAFDGKHLYMAPLSNGSPHGQVTRYNTHFGFQNDGVAKLSIFNTSSQTWTLSKTYIGYDSGATYLPVGGAIDFEYYNGYLYLTFPYHADYSQAGREGLCKLNLATNISSFFEPGWSTGYADYKFSHIKLISGPKHPELLVSGDYGITRYDLIDDDWILFNNATLPNLTSDDDDTNFFDVTHDKTSNLILCGKVYDSALWEGLVGFPIEGLSSRQRYKINSWGGASWTLKTLLTNSYSVYDITAVDADAKGYRGIAYDGRYIYFSPGYNGAYHGHVARYDTQGDFSTASSWEVYDITAVDADAKGYTGIVYDGKYIYFSPYNNGVTFHGHVARYNTQENFSTASSWEVYDITAVDADAKGYIGIVYDGKYIYLSPYNNGVPHGHVARYDTQENFSISYFLLESMDYDTVLALEPVTNNFYAFWTKDKNSKLSLKWDKEISSFDLGPYLLADTDIIIERMIDNAPSRLSFTITKGHLFDESNTKSFYKHYLEKGSTITCRLGENIASTEYWQNQGTFYVKNKTIKYKRSDMPNMIVYCEDIRSVFEDMTLITTEDSNGIYPEALISSILRNKGEIDNSLVSINDMENRALIYCSWVDSKISDILTQLCDRFGYYLRINVDNVFNVKKIDENASVDHTYSNRDTIIDYAPDNSFSDFVNRIIVQSEERIFRESVYPEKEVAFEHGTLGWWQGTEEIKIPYSDDYSLQCLNPYPIIENLAANFLFAGGDLSWTLTADASNTFCTLKFTAPFLMGQLVAALAAALGTNWIPVIGGAISAAGFLEIFRILATETNWSARIMAQPIGLVKAAVEGISNDLTFQTKIGRVIQRILNEPLAYTDEQCQFVADHEMMITRLQRNRIVLTKIGHLQDEDGDIIQIVHPISQENVKILVTSLTRKIRVPSRTDKIGGMFDTIEGWKLS